MQCGTPRGTLPTAKGRQGAGRPPDPLSDSRQGGTCCWCVKGEAWRLCWPESQACRAKQTDSGSSTLAMYEFMHNFNSGTCRGLGTLSPNSIPNALRNRPKTQGPLTMTVHSSLQPYPPNTTETRYHQAPSSPRQRAGRLASPAAARPKMK